MDFLDSASSHATVGTAVSIMSFDLDEADFLQSEEARDK